MNELNIQDSLKLVFINGSFSADLSQLSSLPSDVVLCTLKQALELHADLIKPYINNECLTDGIFLAIPKNKSLSQPIHCLFLNTELNNFNISPRNIIIAGANSRATVIEEYVGKEAENYSINALTTLHAEESAHIAHYKIQAETNTATHNANIVVMQKQNSTVQSFNLTTGGRVTREDVKVALSERGAACHLDGFYHLTSQGQRADHHLYVDHIAAHGSSSMLYKGILDKKSRAVFNGKVHVHSGAQQTNAQQANHNLLLSTDAEVETKPELEIYADDVKCTHGATVGQLDTESLFYLRARGIEEDEARAMLTHAFADDVFSKIENPTIKKYLESRAGRYAE